MAVALEQEMRAEVVKAEAEIPRALAEALRNGSLGVMDYYKMQNVQADTKMKNDIGAGADAYAQSKENDKSVWKKNFRSVILCAVTSLISLIFP